MAIDYREGTLVLSTNSGRYALDDPTYGRDLTTGDAVIVMVGDTWITGNIAHSGKDSDHGRYSVERARHGIIEVQGYYVECEHGVLGLCSGMRIRVYI